MGKHYKPRSQRKTELVRLRVSKTQKKTLADAALRAGLGVSSWLLMVGLKAAESS